jgi:lysophospholipase L1-like esterase
MTGIFRKAVSLFLVAVVASLSLVPAAEARRVALSAGYSGAFGTFNINSANTAAIRTAWAGVNNVNIAFSGDSTMAGQSAGVGTAQAVNSWPMQMAGILRGMGINAGANNIFSDKGSWGLAQTIANFETGDGRVQHTGAAALGATKAVGGNAFNWSATGTLSFTPQDSVDTMSIWWRDGAAGRNFTWAIDGGGFSGNINSTGVTQLTVMPPTTFGTATTHTVNMSWALGSITIIGVSAWNSTLGKELSLLNWGISGATSANLIDNTDAAAGRLATINSVKPAGVFFEAGINDWRTSVTVAAFKANVVTMVQTVLANSGNIILVVPVFDPGSTGNAANQTQYVQAMYQVAAEYNVPLFDIRKIWVSNANAVALGYQPSGDVHPTTAGYASIAAATAKVIQAIINNSFAANDNVPLDPEAQRFASLWMRDLDVPANDNVVMPTPKVA